MHVQHFILDKEGAPQKVELDSPLAFLRWAIWFQTDQRRVVAHDHVRYLFKRHSCISTVFVARVEAANEFDAAPTWETAVFGGYMDGHRERCSGTREQAEAMHAKVLAMTKARGPWAAFKRILASLLGKGGAE